jgi:hypothetical protein
MTTPSPWVIRTTPNSPAASASPMPRLARRAYLLLVSARGGASVSHRLPATASVIAADGSRTTDGSVARYYPVRAAHAATPANPATAISGPGVGRCICRERATTSVAKAPTSATNVTAKARISGRA